MKTLMLATLMILSVPAFANEGVSVRGGANSVGGQLYDDYEQDGVKQLTSKEVFAYVKPIFQRVDKMLAVNNHGNYGPDTYNQYGPSGSEDFLELLSYGLDGIKWYLDPKPLDQKGRCQNHTVLSVQKVVRACQSDLSVRIDRKFFEGNPDLQAALVLHELLTWVKLHQFNGGITDEGVRDANRALRDTRISNADLVSTLEKDGFGSYSAEDTAAEAKAKANATAHFNAMCAQDHQYSCSCPGYRKTGVFIWGLGVVGQSEKEKGFGCH
jgi:hypothetical protein